MAWATVEQVLAMTGETVTEIDLAVASSIIDTVAGTDEESTDGAYTTADVRALRRATCWQAPWVRDHPGLLTERETATSVSADSTNVQRDSPVDVYLAPLARRELLNLSWFRTRTVRVRRDEALKPYVSFLNEASDPPWLGQ